ncbi:rhomboid family intramembrane serine protease [Paraoerskovia sediminicola]|uniref:Rhomboid family intramembrane serine protease n=1 Tax=Paraoerskovia sediminicola TaxID=1138587 RepID=A0ABM8G226_9CELL|nr:rhomboid family intramembrane serine protease [Paraoerskovia sediminicola]
MGVQCVDCVQEAARTAPQQRTVFGGTVRQGRPVVTLTIIGICAVSWVLQLVTGGAWTQRWVFAPFLGESEPWRFLTAAFLHSTSPLHILFNMYALWLVGPFLEQALGRVRFASLYLLAAVGGQVGVLLLASPEPGGGWTQGVVGASGAVFGLFGAIFLLMRRLGRNATQILVLVAINMAIPFFVGGIAWQAHVGGLIVGMAVGAAYAYAPRSMRQTFVWLVPVVTMAILIGLSMWKYSTVGPVLGLLG